MEPIKRSIKQDYLTGDASLRPFYQYPLQSPDFGQIIQDKAREDIDREALHRVITEQYDGQGLEMTDATRHNLDSLRQSNTYTITTGHQLVLFGGPLFTVYKVLSTIQLAEQLREKYPDHQFVPLFWIHTEDHDFDEINHYYDSFEEVIRYQADCQGPVGRHVLTEAIRAATPPDMEARFTRWYTPGNTLTEAFRGFMNELFGEYGIVILDPDHADLKQRFAAVIKGEITAQKSFEHVGKTSANLEAAGYPAQINSREINLFFMEDEGRNRIVGEGDAFRVLNTEHTFDQEKLLALLAEHPEYISPNVSLRPLYQEMILPNLAYIGGWAEMAYWLQLKGVFDHYQVNFPLILPRMMATVFRESELEAWTNLGFSPENIQQQQPELYRAYMPKVWDDAEFMELKKGLLTQFGTLESYIQQFSNTLPRSVVGQQVQTEKFFANLEKKLHRVLRQEFSEDFGKIDTLKSTVFPDGKVQERVLSLAAFSDLSPTAFVAAIYPHVNVLNPEHCYITLANL